MTTTVRLIERLIVVCDLHPQAKTGRRGSRGTLHFDLTEFAELSDGRRIELRSDRGFSIGRHPTPRSDEMSWVFPILPDLRVSIANTLLPDEPIDGHAPTLADHWRHALRVLAQAGIESTPEQLESLPQVYQFGPGILALAVPTQSR